MKRTLAIFLSAIFIFSSALLFTACDNGTVPEVTDKTSGDVTQPITDPVTDAVTEATDPVTDSPTEPVTEPATDPVTEPVTEPVVVDPVIGFINPLTGLPTEEDISSLRPVAVSIDNVLKAQPTIGLSLADVIIEVPAEGYESRLLAIYLDYQDLPTIGNVRSVREYSARFAADFDTILIHAGADTDDGWLQLGPNAIMYGFLISDLMKKGEITAAAEREDLWYTGIDNIDSLNYYPNPMFRDLDRMYNMSTEHSLMVNGDVIVDSIEYRNYRTNLADGFTYPYTIGTENSTPTQADASSVFLPYNPYRSDYGVSYVYDSANGLYKRSNFDNQPTVDGMNNEQVSFKNVIIIEVPTSVFPNDPKNRLNVTYVGEGKGYYFVNGKYEEITWKRESADKTLTLLGADGNHLDIVPGKVMINVYPTEYHDSMIIK